MSRASISDDELIAQFDIVTIWAPSRHAPKDIWSLGEAIRWIVGQEEGATITLFRPGDARQRAIWIAPDQIARLAIALKAKQAP